MKYLAAFATGIVIMLAGCTYSITQIHTEGMAEDVVDETSTNSPTIEPSLTIPAL